MNDIPRLFQAFVGPAIFVSATALLLLSPNVRLMGMVSRLRQYLHEKYRAAKQGRGATSQTSVGFMVRVACLVWKPSVRDAR